jgi:hypothetical protein
MLIIHQNETCYPAQKNPPKPSRDSPGGVPSPVFEIANIGVMA